MRFRYIDFARPVFSPRIENGQAAPLVAAALIRPACVFWTWCQAVNLARDPRPFLRPNSPGVLKTRSVFSAACAAFFPLRCRSW